MKLRFHQDVGILRLKQILLKKWRAFMDMIIYLQHCQVEKQFFGSLTKAQHVTRQLKSLLEGHGTSEAISYALTTEEKSRQFMMKESQTTRLQWPMSEERSVLRMNLISGLLDDVAYNVARKNNNIAFYEVGRVFYQTEDPTKIYLQKKIT